MTINTFLPPVISPIPFSTKGGYLRRVIRWFCYTRQWKFEEDWYYQLPGKDVIIIVIPKNFALMELLYLSHLGFYCPQLEYCLFLGLFMIMVINSIDLLRLRLMKVVKYFYMIIAGEQGRISGIVFSDK